MNFRLIVFRDLVPRSFGEEISDETAGVNTVHNVALILNDLILRVRTTDQMEKVRTIIKMGLRRILHFCTPIVNYRKNYSPLQVKGLIDKLPGRLPPWIADCVDKQTKRIQWCEENAPILGEWLHDHLPHVSAAA